MTDTALIEKKLAFIETCVRELGELAQPDRLGSDVREARFVEHTLQIAIQAALDVASQIVSARRLGEPETNRALFDLLCKAKLIEEPLAESLYAMAGVDEVVIWHVKRRQGRRSSGGRTAQSVGLRRAPSACRDAIEPSRVRFEVQARNLSRKGILDDEPSDLLTRVQILREQSRCSAPDRYGDDQSVPKADFRVILDPESRSHVRCGNSVHAPDSVSIDDNTCHRFR
jgi:uncharacterized protein YutE (UPF0331/DUF86 family)